ASHARSRRFEPCIAQAFRHRSSLPCARSTSGRRGDKSLVRTASPTSENWQEVEALVPTARFWFGASACTRSRGPHLAEDSTCEGATRPLIRGSQVMINMISISLRRYFSHLLQRCLIIFLGSVIASSGRGEDLPEMRP